MHWRYYSLALTHRYMCHWTGSSLVYVMAWRHTGGEPFFYKCRVIVNWILMRGQTDRRTDGQGESSIPPSNFVGRGYNKFNKIIIKTPVFSFRKICLTMLSTKFSQMSIIFCVRSQCVHSSPPQCHIYASMNQVSNGSDNGLSAPSHHLNQCRITVNWTLMNKLQWIQNQYIKRFIHENAFENAVCHFGGHFLSALMC